MTRKIDYYLMGDFETSKQIVGKTENSKGEVKNVYKAQVWASCVTNIMTGDVLRLDDNIDDTMHYLLENSKKYNIELYYHNLKFDGQFILNWLLRNGYTHDQTLTNSKSFDTIITDMGQYYQITVKVNKGKNSKRLIIRDSLKILPLKVEELAKAFNLKTLKGSIDYSRHDREGVKITKEEWDYIKNDCLIVGECLKQTFEQGHTKMTSSANALAEYKDRIGKNKFNDLFPNQDNKMYSINETTDEFIRKSYKGGYTFVNPKYKNKVIKKEGRTYDVNSLYPYVMYSRLLPVGQPLSYDGEYELNADYPLFIQRLKCRFKLKKGFIPTVQIKGNIRFGENEYITDSGAERVTLTMTSIDLEIFFKHYDVTNIEYLGGYMFRGEHNLFKDYIDYWSEVKKKSTGGMRQLAKLMLNSLYGKFATSTDSKMMKPILINEVVKLEEYEGKDRKSVYTAMASFITAYAREITISAFQSNIDICCYADTDSIHIIGDTDNIWKDNKELGAWKLEGVWTEGKFIRPKTYYEELVVENLSNVKLDNIKLTKLDIKCCGMPQNCKEKVRKEDFKNGYKVFGKLVPIKCIGGVVLEETYFTIKG